MFLLFKLEKARSLHYKGHRRLSWVSFCCLPYINAWRMNMYIRSAYAMFHIIDPCIRVTIKKLLQMNEENNKNFKLSDIELIMIWPYRNYNVQLKVLNLAMLHATKKKMIKIFWIVIWSILLRIFWIKSP